MIKLTSTGISTVAICTVTCTSWFNVCPFWQVRGQAERVEVSNYIPTYIPIIIWNGNNVLKWCIIISPATNAGTIWETTLTNDWFERISRCFGPIRSLLQWIWHIQNWSGRLYRILILQPYMWANLRKGTIWAYCKCVSTGVNMRKIEISRKC